MGILSQVSIDKAIAFLKSYLRKNKFFIRIDNDSFSKFSGSKRGNKVYAHLTELKIKPIVESLVKNKTAYFVTLTHQYDLGNPSESWTYMKIEVPKFIRKNKFESYLYVYEAHKHGGCHCHLIVAGKINNDKIKQTWEGHIKIKKIKNEKIGSYLTKEIGKAGHVESALKNWDTGKISANDVKKIWRFYYLITLKIRGWNCSRNLKIRESETSDLITYMNNSTSDKPSDKQIILSLPRKIVKNPIFRPYNEKLKENQSDFKLIIDFLASLKILIGSRLSLETQREKPNRLTG